MTRFDEILKTQLPSKKPIIEIDFDEFDISLFTEDNLLDINDARLGNKVRNAVISIYNKEGRLPHFHIWSRTDDFEEICVRLDTNKYFNHGYKTGTLNSSGRKALCEKLKKKYVPANENKVKFEGAIIIYNALCIGWNLDSNNHIKVDPNAEMPNYRTIYKADN